MPSTQSKLLEIASNITTQESVVCDANSLRWANTVDFYPGLYVDATYARSLGRGLLLAAEMRIIDDGTIASLMVSSNPAYEKDYEDGYAALFYDVFAQYSKQQGLVNSIGMLGLHRQPPTIVVPTVWTPSARSS